jgi:dUTP pyrophosphatase
MTEVQIINNSRHPLPSYATPGSAGVDLTANINKPINLDPLQRVLVPTGIFIALPQGTEAQIRSRSGLAYKQGISVLNSPGTIDADYRGEVKVLLVNLSDKKVEIQDGDRIAQMILAKHEIFHFKAVSVLNDTVRGEGGFGSTGVNKQQNR